MLEKKRQAKVKMTIGSCFNSIDYVIYIFYFLFFKCIYQSGKNSYIYIYIYIYIYNFKAQNRFTYVFKLLFFIF